MFSLAYKTLFLSFLAHPYSQSQNLCQLALNVSICLLSIRPHKAVYELAVVIVNPLNMKKIPSRFHWSSFFMHGSICPSVTSLPCGNKCSHESVYIVLKNMPPSLHTRNNQANSGSK